MYVLRQLHKSAPDFVTVRRGRSSAHMPVEPKGKCGGKGQWLSAFRQVFKDRILLLIQRLSRCVHSVKQDEHFGRVVQSSAIDGVEGGYPARLMIVEQREVVFAKARHGIPSRICHLHVYSDATRSIELAVAVFRTG